MCMSVLWTLTGAGRRGAVSDPHIPRLVVRDQVSEAAPHSHESSLQPECVLRGVGQSYLAYFPLSLTFTSPRSYTPVKAFIVYRGATYVTPTQGRLPTVSYMEPHPYVRCVLFRVVLVDVAFVAMGRALCAMVGHLNIEA